MEYTTRLEKFLRLMRRWKFCNREIVQHLFFPDDKDGSVTRDFLRKAVLAKYARRIDDTNKYRRHNAPVYTATEQGCCEVATRTGDMSLLLDRPANTRSPQDFPHHLGVTRVGAEIDQAFADQKYADRVSLFTEHDLVNPDAEPDGRVVLLTEVGENTRGWKVVCVPDFAFLMKVGPFRRAYYFEFETGSDGSPSRVMARKAPGYAGLNDTKKYRLHFPQADDMRVVAVCPNAGWRETMRKQASKEKGRELWLFVARPDITPGTFLHGEIFHDAEGRAKSLAGPAPGTAPPPAPAREPVPGAVGGARA